MSRVKLRNPPLRVKNLGGIGEGGGGRGRGKENLGKQSSHEITYMLNMTRRPSFRIVMGGGGAIAMIAELRGGMAVAYHMHFAHIAVTTLPFLIEQCSV